MFGIMTWRHLESLHVGQYRNCETEVKILANSSNYKNLTTAKHRYTTPRFTAHPDLAICRGNFISPNLISNSNDM